MLPRCINFKTLYSLTLNYKRLIKKFLLRLYFQETLFLLDSIQQRSSGCGIIYYVLQEVQLYFSIVYLWTQMSSLFVVVFIVCTPIDIFWQKITNKKVIKEVSIENFVFIIRHNTPNIDTNSFYTVVMIFHTLQFC